MTILINELKSRVPHRYPILLMDRIDELTAHREITATKAVTCNEPWYQRIPDDAPLDAYAYPEPLLIESWCQTAGVLALWSTDDPDSLQGKAMLFGSITGINVLRRVFPGDVLRHHVLLTRRTDTTYVFEGTCAVDGQTVLEITSAVVTIRDQDQLRPQTIQQKEEASE